MRNPRLFKLLPLLHKTMARIEWRGGGLGIQHHRSIAPLARLAHQQLQNLPSDTSTAPRLAHRHAADMPIGQQAACADSTTLLIVGNSMQTNSVHGVELDLGRHFLFIDKDFKTDGGSVLAQSGPVAEVDVNSGHDDER